MASEVDICNSALTKIGAERITSLADNTRQAILCNAQYPLIRDSLLSVHSWNFAIKRADLVVTGNDPEYEFENEYTLPADCLRVIDTQFEDTFYQVEGDKLYANVSELKIRYIAKITDTTKFSPKFVELLALALAIDLSYSLLQSASLTQNLDALYQRRLRDARSIDAQENPSYGLTNDEFIRSRF